MKKKFSAVIFALLMVLVVLPKSAMAVSFESEFFPSGKISTPVAAYINYNGLNTVNSDSIDIWYNMPKDLLNLASEYSKITNTDQGSEEFVGRFGIEDYNIAIQVDAKVDNNSWQYTSEWDEPDWYGLDTPYYLAFMSYEPLSNDLQTVYYHSTTSWLTYLSDSEEGFLYPIVKKFTNEYDESGYNYDFTNHTLAIRYRFILKYRENLGEEFKTIFSDWSKESSIGKNGSQKVPAKPTSLEAPKISEFSLELLKDNDDIEGTEAKYNINIPSSVYDAVLYCEAVANMFEPLYIETQMRINNGDWEEIYTANPVWIFDGYRAASPYNYNLQESDSIDFRVRIVCSELGLYSDWSNIIGTKATAKFISSTWASELLYEADRLGLIPDRLRDADLTKPITRAEFAAVGVKTYEALTGTATLPVEKNPFKDTKDEEVLKAYNTGITLGTSDTTFDPDKLLNREQAATMLTNLYKKYAITDWDIHENAKFEDIFVSSYTMPEKLFSDDDKISGWAKSSVYFMVAKNIISGIGDNTFAPKATTDAEVSIGYAQATREQALVMATKMVKNLNTNTSLQEKTTL